MSYLAFTVIKIERDALNAAEKRVHGSPAFNFQLSPQGSSYSTNRLSGTIMSLIIRPCMLTEGRFLFFFSRWYQDAPRAIGPNQRFVWLIGRPLEGLPGILSACGFPYLHWAVLINPPGLSRDRIIALFQTLRSPASVGRIAPQPIGQVHQLHFERNTGRTSRHVAGFTVLEFSQQFPRFSIAYVGLTTRTDQEINDLGSPSVAGKLKLFSAGHMANEIMGLSSVEKQLSTLRFIFALDHNWPWTISSYYFKTYRKSRPTIEPVHKVH